jgi:5-methylcytosine-specific restriction endonuclease McrA
MGERRDCNGWSCWGGYDLLRVLRENIDVELCAPQESLDAVRGKAINMSLKAYIDKELKASRGYRDPQSIVWSDGRERLVGRDWEARKQELWRKARGKCEYFVRCTAAGEHPHHIQKRSDGRDDRLENLKLLCGYHHNMMHPEKQTRCTGAKHEY